MKKLNFKNKNITVMGLGLLGRGIGVVKFLAKLGAKFTVTDLKSKKELHSSLDELKKFKNIKYILGKHRLIDFRNKDMVIKAAGVPLDSIYIKEAQKNEIPVEMDASLFAKLSAVTIIGITGSKGKSTVTHLVYKILKAFHSNSSINVYLGGNVRGLATLPLLEKVKKNDIVVLELDSWQLQGFGDSKISPYISIFTNFMPDHLNYYKGNMNQYFKDKANIFKYQNESDYLIVSEQAYQEIKKRFKGKIKSRVIKSEKFNLKTKLIGTHNQENASLTVQALRLLRIPNFFIKKQMEKYSGEPGRLEFIRKYKGIVYCNDNSATTPDATIAGLRTLFKNKRNIILLGGGSDKKLKYDEMIKEINKTVKALILFKGNATDKIISKLPEKTNYSIDIVDNMKDAIKRAKEFSKKGDIILLSPGAASFGIFKNEFDRGDQFVGLVKKIK